MEFTPIFAVIVGLTLIAAIAEALYVMHVQKIAYDWRESLASLAVALIGRLLRFTTLGVATWFVSLAFEHRLWTLTTSAIWYWPTLFLVEEFLYYWFHRVSHECRWFWATHAVHHSSNHLYLFSAMRLGWTGPITGSFVFFLSLFLIGFAPEDALLVIAINLLYQYGLHTELVGRLGWFDLVFNSPSNHRVHHATDKQYLNKNFGGVIMLFDHCFATYQAEQQPIANYGVMPVLKSYHPAIIALHEWYRLWVAMRSEHDFAKRVKIVFGKPE